MAITFNPETQEMHELSCFGCGESTGNYNEKKAYPDLCKGCSVPLPPTWQRDYDLGTYTRVSTATPRDMMLELAYRINAFIDGVVPDRYDEVYPDDDVDTRLANVCQNCGDNEFRVQWHRETTEYMYSTITSNHDTDRADDEQILYIDTGSADCEDQDVNDEGGYEISCRNCGAGFHGEYEIG